MEESLAIEEVLPQEPQQPGRRNNFALAVVASLILHGVCSVALLGLPSGTDSSPQVTYLDLSMTQPAAAAPKAAPAKPQVVPAPKPAAVPEKAEIPEPVTQPEQPEQPKPAPEQPKPAPEQPAAPPQEQRADEHLPHNSLGLGLTRGFFKSLGEGETLRAGVKEYYLDMLQGINEKWWLDQELQKVPIQPIVINLTIARNGAIVASSILMSSGNIRYDKAVLAALKSASPLPPLPASYHGEFFEAPIRLVPPLNLMNSWQNL